LTSFAPEGAKGNLRFFIIDPDNFAGGRIQRISVEGREVGVFRDFQKGKWVEVEIGEKDTMDGVISVVMENLKQGGNAVVSFVQFKEKR